VAEKKDPLNNELSVEAKIDETGIKAGAKSRALSAFDRLCGSLIDIPSAYAEGVAARIRAKSEVRELMIEAEGQAAKQKLLYPVPLSRTDGNRNVLASR
jgi:hypothetical protein